MLGGFLVTVVAAEAAVAEPEEEAGAAVGETVGVVLGVLVEAVTVVVDTVEEAIEEGDEVTTDAVVLDIAAAGAAVGVVWEEELADVEMTADEAGTAALSLA